jgi:hypothetical protein
MRTAIAIGAGAVVLVIGVVLFVGGHGSLGASAAEARMPGSLSFGADERNYAVALRGAAVPDAAIDAVRCVVRRSDGSSKSLRGDQQDDAAKSGDARSVGAFDATTGLTRVRCQWAPGVVRPPTRMLVAPQTNTVRTIAVVLIAIGALGVGVGLWPLARQRLT